MSTVFDYDFLRNASAQSFLRDEINMKFSPLFFGKIHSTLVLSTSNLQVKAGNFDKYFLGDNYKSFSRGHALPGIWVLDPWKVFAGEFIPTISKRDSLGVEKSLVSSLIGSMYQDDNSKALRLQESFQNETKDLMLDKPFGFSLGESLELDGLWHVYELSGGLSSFLVGKNDINENPFNLKFDGYDASHICMNLDSGLYFCVLQKDFHVLELCIEKK